MTPQVMHGLRPTPLASYLAGLGLVRLLGEQADPDLTAAWSADGLVVETAVDDVADCAPGRLHVLGAAPG